jgi:hypothetical protein
MFNQGRWLVGLVGLIVVTLMAGSNERTFLDVLIGSVTSFDAWNSESPTLASAFRTTERKDQTEERRPIHFDCLCPPTSGLLFVSSLGKGGCLPFAASNCCEVHLAPPLPLGGGMGDRFSLLNSSSTDSKNGGSSSTGPQQSPPPSSSSSSDRFGGMEVLEPPPPPPQYTSSAAAVEFLGSRNGEAASNGGFHPDVESRPDDNLGRAQEAAAIESAQADPTGILSSSSSSSSTGGNGSSSISSRLLHDDGSSHHQLPQQDVIAGDNSSSSHHHPLAPPQQQQQQHSQQMVLLPMPPSSTVAPPPVPPPPGPGPAACVICHRPAEDGRPLLHFAPVPHDASVMSSAPTVRTFPQRVFLHVFCGKTASILPHVNQPDLEILSKAGLKNKHGTGPEVNASLARTRSACVNPPTTKDKEFYLVREFEAHLSAVRGTSISLLGLIPVASADPYGNWRGPHQQYLIEQQQRELQQQQQQEEDEAGVVDPSQLPNVDPNNDLGGHATGDVLLGLQQHLADSALQSHPFSLPSSGTDPDPDDVGRGDVPAVNDEADDHDEAELDGTAATDSMDIMNGRSGDALSSSETTTPANDKKRGSSSPSTTSASETEWKIPRKRLTSSSSSSTPSRDGGVAMHPSSSLLGSNGTHFLDHPTFPYTTTNGGASYRGTSLSNLSPPPIPDGDGVQPLYHSMLISSSSSSLDASMLLGNGFGVAAPWTAGSRSVVGQDGVVRIQCVCGGRHLPRDSAKGMASWRSHFMTKRHQKWLQSQGLVGAV